MSTTKLSEKQILNQVYDPALEVLNVAMDSDIEIGAVELKDGTTDTRGTVNAANTARTTGTTVLVTQSIDATGKVSPAGEVVGNAPFVRVGDGTDTLLISGTGGARIDLAEQTLTAVKVSATSAANTVSNPIFAAVGDGTTTAIVETSGTKKALNVNLSDGTNDMPTMDANTRAGFVQVTDGTNEVDIIATINSLKSDIASVGGEVVVADNGAGASVTKIIPVGGKYNATPPAYTDGDVSMLQTNSSGELKVALSSDIEIGAVELKNDASDDRANISDANTARTTGTHVLAVQEVGADGTVPPTGSLNTNAPFVKLTDGTSDLTLGTGTQKTVPVEISDGTTGADVIATINSLKVDTSSVAGTVTAVNSGVASAGTQRIALARDARGNSIPSELESPYDFAVAYTSNVSVTCSGAPITIDDANCTVLWIQGKPTATGIWGARYVNGEDGISLTAAANVITMTGGGTPFLAADTYRVGISSQRKAYDKTNDLLKIQEQSPVWAKYTDVVSLIGSAQNFTGSMADLGSEIDCRGYKYLRVFLTLDINDSFDCRIAVLAKHTSAGAEEYIYDPNKWTVRDSTLSAFGAYREWNTDADALYILEIEMDNAIPYIQIQIQAGTVGGTAGQIDAAYYVRGY